MRTLLYKLLFLTLLIPIAGFSNNGKKFKGKHTKEKTITQEFSVASDALLKVSNSYGTVHMTSWDKNTVAIEVLIQTNGDSEEKVIERLKQVDVDFNNSSTMVSARTRFGSNTSKSWFKWTKRNKVSVTVNYTIKFPKGNALNISNDHGSIFINRAENKVSLNCDYGRMEIGELLGDDNMLNFDYTNNVTIAFMKSGRINADYSSFTINNAEDIELNTEHTKSRFGTINTIVYNCDYNLLEIGQANNVKGSGEYLSLRLGVITGNLDIKADYGSIKVAEMTDDAGDIRIRSELAGIKIGYQPQYHFNFEISVEYTSVKGDEGFTMNKKRIEAEDRYYQGFYGNSSSRNNININSEYGSIRFIKL
ncbi:DUF4097 family beta strand repeat-containing protein [Kordia jejudonensis]|uniref:hypothetical protein n=1 Tax=Kordia jejudonensis TaxID=1348245 RepID=UPI0006293985|nr:hypothetical protein [Kordia jejudonensis]